MLFSKTESYMKHSGIDSLLGTAPAVIVGFSGGADSTVLLSFFLSLREKFPEMKIIAAHVNHMIRGEEAEKDQIFCENFCKLNVIPFELLKEDVPALAKKTGKSIEEAARDARYAFFDRLRIKYNGALIATAHNSDDNLETVIINLCRGSGTKGISGISPVRDGIYIRPLLSSSSEEIRTYAKEKGIAYVTDSTNANTVYTRNAVRAGIVPAMKAINPKVCHAALRLSESARADCDFIEGEAKRFLSENTIDRQSLKNLHPAVLHRVILFLYRDQTGLCCDLSERNISDCKKLLSNPEGGFVSLPHGVIFSVDKNDVYLGSGQQAENESDADSKPVTICYDRLVDFFDFTLICTEKDELINIFEENIYNLSLHERIDCDKINGKLFARKRLPGDTVRIGNMNKKLKKLLCDADIPRHVREKLPIICDDSGILYVPYIGIRDGARATKDSKKIINLHISKRSGT